MWSENNNDILAQFIKSRGIADETARTVLCIALLAQRDDERLYGQLDQLDQTPAILDTPVLLDILRTASAPQIASVLWSPVGRYFSTAQFERLFRIVLDSSPSDCTLYELVGASVDFLLLHPGVFSIPLDIVFRLTESPNVDSRVVAMKAFSHSEVSLRQHVDYILRCLQSRNESEKDVGLYQLGELIDRNGIRLLESLDSDCIQQLHQMLDELTRDQDEVRRIAAAVHRDALIEWGNNSEGEKPPGEQNNRTE